MNEPGWIVGIDLGKETPWLSCYPAQRARSVQTDMADKKGAAAFSMGTYRDEGRPYLVRFLKELLSGCGVDGPIAYISVTSASEELEEDLTKAAAEVAGEGKHCFLSHELSYTWYALSQRPELWTRDNGLFEYEGKTLQYTHLEISSGRNPAYVKAEKMDLSSFMEKAGESSRAKDEGFAQAIAHVCEGKAISAFYLTGRGFEDAYEGEKWMDTSLRQLFAMRRHVFIGQNLFARGACLAGYYAVYPKGRPDFLSSGMDLTLYDLSIVAGEGGRKSFIPLLPSRQPWRSAAGRARILSFGDRTMQLYARHTVTGEEKLFRLELEQIPGRPERTLRFAVNAVYEEEGICRVTISDMGFGQFYPSSGNTAEKRIDLNGPSEMEDMLEKIRIRPAAPSGKPVLEMPLSGVQIASTDELSWYIYENVYMLDEDFFAEPLYTWLDTKTGNTALSASLRRVSQGGRGAADAYRAMLSYFGLLETKEISAVCASIGQLQRLTPLEKARIKADGLCRYGNDMEALKLYHHAAWLMDNEEFLVSDKLRAVIWHNMGVCLAKLHDTQGAEDCMRRAFEAGRDRQYLDSWLCVLYIAGRQDEMDKTAREAGFGEEEADQARSVCRNAERAYAQSSRGLGMRAGLLLKNMPGQTGYRGFIQEYMQAQLSRYGVLRLPGSRKND